MRFIPIILALIIATFISCKDDSAQPVSANPFHVRPGEAPLVVAHRGGRGLAPENTITAFDNAMAMKVDVLEMDVCLTADDVLVTSHDVTIDRTSNGSGNISDFTYAELQDFNFGYDFQAIDGTFPYRDAPVRIPRLEEILAKYPGQLMEIEVKDSGQRGKKAANKLVELLRAYDMTPSVMVFSFFDDVMQHINNISGNDIQTGASIGESLNFFSAVSANKDTILPLKSDMFAWPYDLPILSSNNILKAAHRSGAGVHYWTINDKDEMKSFIGKGADGIITDRPDLMLEALEEMGF